MSAVRAAELIDGFEPESDLERVVAAQPALLEGLAWGKPRRGHPEGCVGHHVADLLKRINGLEPGEKRAPLRFIALVHDSFKYQVRDWMPKSGENHHAMRARRFAGRFTDDERTLCVIELHDRPYALWRKMRRTGSLDRHGFDSMMAKVRDTDLFLAFVDLDGSTEGKSPEPTRWFRAELEQRGAGVGRR